MELHYGLKQPLRFSTNINHRNNNKVGAGISLFNIYTPTDYMPPFQLKRDAAAIGIQSVKYVNTETLVETEVLADLDTDQLIVLPFDTWDQIIHFGSAELANPLAPGRYYIQITDNITTWYSEDIKVADFDKDALSAASCILTKIEYWDTCDISDICYSTIAFGYEQYKQIMFLDLDVGAPAYDYEAEGDEDGEMNFVPEYIKLEKRYLLEGVFPEYFVDALSLLPLHINPTATIRVTSHRGLVADMVSVTMTPEWIEPYKTWAQTELEFVTKTVVKTNCCEPKELSDDCLRVEMTEVLCMVEEGTPDYTNRQYTDPDTGTKVDIPEGSHVLVKGASSYSYRQLNGGLYEFFIVLQETGDVFVVTIQRDADTPTDQIYYYSNGWAIYDVPVILFEIEDPDSGRRLVKGHTWEGSVVSLYAKLSVGPDVLISQADGATFNSDGIVFDRPANAEFLYLVANGLNCTLGTSDDYELLAEDATGIGVMQIGGSNQVG